LEYATAHPQIGTLPVASLCCPSHLMPHLLESADRTARFDKIDHMALMDQVRHRIGDKWSCGW